MLPVKQKNNDYDPWSLLEGEDEEPVDSDSLSDKGERVPSTPVKSLDPAQSISAQTNINKAVTNMSTPPPMMKPPFVPPKAVVVHKLSSNVSGSHSLAFIEKQRQRLLDLRDSLMDSMSGMTRDTIHNVPEGSVSSGSGQHQGDAGSDAYDRDFALSVLAEEEDAVYEVEQALRRIKANTYGNCEISERKIDTARLVAIPFARLTVECQTEWEKEYGNRRFRPSDEVSFGRSISEKDEEKLRREKEDALLVAQSAEKIRKEEQITEQIKKQQEEQGVQREKEDALTAAKELEEAKRRIEELEASLGVKSEQITKEKAPIAAPKSELRKPNKADESTTEKQEDDVQSPNKVTINRSLFNK